MRSRKPLIVCSIVLLATAAAAFRTRYGGRTVERAVESSSPPRAEESFVQARAQAFPRREVARPVLASPEEYRNFYAELERELPLVAAGDMDKLGYFCTGDFNRDNTVDAGDLAAFIDRWGRNDGMTAHLADINRDGFLDEEDVADFLGAYFDNGCDPEQQKSTRFMVC